MENETLFILDVLYPPQISNAETKLVAIEGSNFSIYCNVSLGNPRETFITWISDSDAEVEKAGQLINFLNISRTDEGNFACIARNRMKPTGCAEEDGVDKQQFYVDVQYKARIQRFAALSATVNHTEELSFVCDIDSDPPASVSIMSTNGTTLYFTRGNNQLRYRKTSSCLDDNGNFTCTSENKHNGGSPESRNVTVDVRCSPIYPRNYSPETVIKSQIGDQTILNFSIFSNPLPTSVIWTNLSNNMQLHANTSESDRVFIETSDDMLSSVVVIKCIEPWDSGNYSVRVKNEFGNLTETFHIVLDETSPTSINSANIGGSGGSALIGGFVSTALVLIALLIVTVIYVYKKRQSSKPNNDLHAKNDNSQHDENGYEELAIIGRRTGEKEYSELDFQERKDKTNQNKPSAGNETYENLKLGTR
ncbi:myelin-associated glycoprotein-like isoform X2 [Mya arenaria]|uniref:myelin-associated glycoprotein-like isoform X2 n=1 Tax=Mya arenaria TaxID=6604 RepID=UPI0022E44A62|nr:myelin-associated glycoprotein-like isoform X2 [Mya arenaria]